MAGTQHTGIDRVALAGAPLLLLVSTLASGLGDGFNRDALGGVVQVYAMALFIPAVFALLRTVGATAPGLAGGLRLLAGLGIAGGVGFGLDAVHVAEHGASAVDFGGLGILSLNVPGVLFPLALLGTGAALWRTAGVQGWAPKALMLGAVLFPLSRIPDVIPLAVAADVLLLAAFVRLSADTQRSGAAVAPAV